MAFLMKKYRISTIDAQNRIVAKKWKFSRHQNFLQQLDLWQFMGFELKADEPNLRRNIFDSLRFKLELISNQLDIYLYEESYAKYCGEYMDELAQIERNDMTFKRKDYCQYFCLNCDKDLFYEPQIIKNDVYFDCKYIYTEPLIWILYLIWKNGYKWQQFIYGQIFCFSCELLIGVFNWKLNSGCDCRLHRGLQRYLTFRFFTEKIGVKYKNH